MSLLMDALKRAETSKLEAARNSSGKEALPQAGELSLEPLGQTKVRPGSTPLPDLAEHIDAVDAELNHTASATTNRPSPSPAQASDPQKILADQAAIRNAFIAKNHEPSKRRAFWGILGALTLVGASIAIYFVVQVQRIGSTTLAISSMPPPQAPTETRTAPPAQMADEVSASLPSFAPPPQPTETNLPPPPAPSRKNPIPVPDNGTETPIRLTRSKPEVDTFQLRGYSHIENKELDLARRDYEQSLLRDPNNIDALIALGSIAQHQGRFADAERLFQRAMVANPANPAVLAAVLNGNAANMDPQNTESRIKSLLSSQPESAPLNFALGNLYARQGRWSEAQQHYFNSVAGEADNPDYLFNLAVSLDHMRQERLAVQHYKLALEAAEKRPSAFDMLALRKRLKQLQP